MDFIQKNWVFLVIAFLIYWYIVKPSMKAQYVPGVTPIQGYTFGDSRDKSKRDYFNWLKSEVDKKTAYGLSIIDKAKANKITVTDQIWADVAWYLEQNGIQ